MRTRVAPHLAPRPVPHPAMVRCGCCDVLDFSDLPSDIAMPEPAASPAQQLRRSQKRKAGGCGARAARPPRPSKPTPPPMKTGADLTEALRVVVFATGALIPLFLELFCGSKNLMKGMQVHARVPSFGVDILDGYDMCEPSMQAAVLSAIKVGWVISVWMGLPRDSLSPGDQRTLSPGDQRTLQTCGHCRNCSAGSTIPCST